MNVAVILYGQIRNLHIAAKSWRFIHELDCDFYISTWSKTSQISSRQSGREFVQEITENYIKNTLKNSTISILDEDIVCHENNLKSNCDKSKYHIKNALNLIEKTNKTYDFLMVTRSDQYFVIKKHSIFFFESNQDNTIYSCSEIDNMGERPFINDIFFWGKFKTLKYLIDEMPIDNIGLHNFFAKEIIRLNIKNLSLDMGISNVTVRPNALELLDSEINFNNLDIKSRSW